MRLRVSPTRMELQRMRKRLALATRGHALLEDKLEGLIGEFQPLVEKYAAMRTDVERELVEALRLFVLAEGEGGSRNISTALEQAGVKPRVKFGTVRKMGVAVPEFDFRGFDSASYYSLVTTPGLLDVAVQRLRSLLPKLFELVETEEAIRRLGTEIEKTRRRTNALEYVIVPQVRETVKYISSKLDENERGQRVRLMKVKELLERERAAAGS